MDDEPARPDGVSDTLGDEAPAPPLPTLPDAVTANADELRQLIDAGAGSPEELRALAERIRAHRALEESLWRAEVRPALRKAKKRRFTLRDLRDPADRPRSTAGGLRLAAVVLAGVAVLLLAATQSSVLWILLPVAAVLIYAYRQGRQADAVADEPPSVESPPS